MLHAALVETTAGTLLQLAFDIPAGLLEPALVLTVRFRLWCSKGARVAAAFLSLHLWCGRVFVLVTVVLIAVVPATSLAEIWTAYLTSKTSAFFWLIPHRRCVRAHPHMRSRGAAKPTEPTTRGNAVMRDPAHLARLSCRVHDCVFLFTIRPVLGT